MTQYLIEWPLQQPVREALSMQSSHWPVWPFWAELIDNPNYPADPYDGKVWIAEGRPLFSEAACVVVKDLDGKPFTREEGRTGEYRYVQVWQRLHEGLKQDPRSDMERAFPNGVKDTRRAIADLVGTHGVHAPKTG